jgi:hypothetical protein
MVNSVEQIQQEMAALDRTTAAIAHDFHTLYTTYLKVLGESVRQQLILAGYHVCTQGYPNQFVELSISQQQELQQSLRELAQQVQANMLETLSEPDMTKPSLSPLPSDASTAPPNHPSTLKVASLTPDSLAEWQDILEQSIAGELQTASHLANRILQQADILPKKLPEVLLQAVGKSEMAEMSAPSPNLLNVLIESMDEGDQKSNRGGLIDDLDDDLDEDDLDEDDLDEDDLDEDDLDEDDLDEELESELASQLASQLEHDRTSDRSSAIVHIVAVHLRLAEIEFADPKTTVLRNRIRSHSNKLKSLGRQYRRKRREFAIAQAQAAWRASWIGER